MPKIRATQDTFLKREIKPAGELPDAYKKLSKKGTEWQVDGVPKSALDLIKKFEGIELHAYADPLTGDEPWTIGYGSTFYAIGIKVKKGDKITQQQADFELVANCKKCFLPALQKIPLPSL